jgi:hypothetical protein
MDQAETLTHAPPDRQRAADHQQPVQRAAPITVQADGKQTPLPPQAPAAQEPDRMPPVDGIAESGIEQAGDQNQREVGG